jgi:hypothetical protein
VAEVVPDAAPDAINQFMSFVSFCVDSVLRGPSIVNFHALWELGDFVTINPNPEGQPQEGVYIQFPFDSEEFPFNRLMIEKNNGVYTMRQLDTNWIMIVEQKQFESPEEFEEVFLMLALQYCTAVPDINERFEVLYGI